MGLFTSFNINASGMTAQRLRSDTISANIANVNTTNTGDGTPYRRKTVVFTEKGTSTFNNKLLTAQGYVGSGVKVSAIVEDTETEMNKVYDPAHPDADEDGYVTYPNVNIVTEMTNMIDASRAYEANVTAFGASKAMALKGLEIGK
ncbi:MAG: flagellar basal body rod protein FlgC [Lachnospiraceae bacterium]|nr:flagellar basal body rod protein FlgC [Lachnospiraceae bacterium]MBQ4069097.1 flagellar basal body rod protein FlgC [Lachnospiraceae bacterium]